MKETQYIEWKESWRDEYLKWISGFANAEGGVLVIGKNDAGKVVGVTDAKKLLVDLPNKVQSVLGILVAVNLRKSGGKEFIEIVVDPYPYPVSYKGEYHVRSSSTKQELKGAALDQFLLKRQGKRWDGVPVPKVGAADLDKPALKRFRERAANSGRLSAEILQERDAGLIDKLHLTEGTFLKRAALLLFHPDPERFVSGAFVKIGYFENNVDLRYQDEVHGNLFAQVDETIAILKAKYLKGLISYEGLQRIETYPLPEAALREAILNAIVHKDYASAIPVQISVYPDKLMIWNPGQLPADWTVKKLLAKHASQPFNPDIANAFFRAGMIESWGRGIERMVAACVAANRPKPEFRYEATGLWAVFQLATQETTQKTAQETPVEKTSVIASGKTSVIASGKTSGKILTHLGRYPHATIPDLAMLLGITERSVERNLQKLQQDQLLRRVGAAKGGHWEVIE